MRNFISNALKFTEQGSVRVQAMLIAENRLRFTVSDTGIGIAPEHHKRIFEEFAQIANPLQQRAKGTGLDLSLSRKLAELLGGHIQVQSTSGEGSTFTLEIPQIFDADAAIRDGHVVEVEISEHGDMGLRSFLIPAQFATVSSIPSLAEDLSLKSNREAHHA